MENVTNENLYQIDWSAGDRKKFLQKLNVPSKRLISRGCTKSTQFKDIWMSDVSAKDARSIKAQLNNSGDFRAFWWNLSDSMYRFCHPQADLHLSMYSFHERHGRLTIGILKFKILFRQIRKEVYSNGVLAGINLLEALSRSE